MIGRELLMGFHVILGRELLIGFVLLLVGSS